MSLTNEEAKPRPRRFLRLGAVLELTGQKHASLYEAIAQGDFPAPVPIGKRTVAWVEDEVLEWQERCIAERERPTRTRVLPNPPKPRAQLLRRDRRRDDATR